MNPQELRVGNWINSYHGTVRVTGLNDGKIHNIITTPDRVGASTGGMYSGIPLTEEWLIKFGWAWNEECKSYEKFPNGDARMNLQFRQVSVSYAMFNYILKATIAERIFYVHQLQNLYFALTGEELILK